MVAPSKGKVARKRVAIYARRSDASGERYEGVRLRAPEHDCWPAFLLLLVKRV